MRYIGRKFCEPWILAVGLLAACGDDSEGSTTFGTSETSTTTGATETGGGTTTGTSSTSGSTSTSSDGTTTNDPSTTTTTAGTSSTGSEGSSSGASADCESIADEGTCQSAPGCLWISMSCLPAGDQCAGVTMMMQCNFISGCTWNDQTMSCDPL